MRIRNVKNKEEIMSNSKYYLKDYKKYYGNWSKYFNNNNPIYLEIGMGKGKFLLQNALANPNINYIGIEKQDSIVAKALLKIPDNINNLVIINANALEIDGIFKSEITKLYLNFSDPWPKKRHHLRRLTSEVFLEKYDDIFINKALVEMRTDNQDLFTYSIISLNNYNYKFEEVLLDLHKQEKSIITSEYEDKFIKEKLPIYYLKALKEIVKKRQ